MIQIDTALTPSDLTSSLDRFFSLAKTKIAAIDREYEARLHAHYGRSLSGPTARAR